MYNKILVALFVSLLIAKYGFKKKLDEKYIYALLACYMIINTFGKQYSAIEMFLQLLQPELDTHQKTLHNHL